MGQTSIRNNSSRFPSQPIRVGVFFGVFCLVGIGATLAPAVDSSVESLSRALVHASGLVIHAFGGEASVEGDVLRSPSNGNAIQMMNGCNGVDLTIVLWPAILAFPALWNQKIAGIAAGAAALQALNLVRFISLFYLRQLQLRVV